MSEIQRYAVIETALCIGGNVHDGEVLMVRADEHDREMAALREELAIKISLEPCGPDGLAWDERDMLGKHIEKMIATPVVERQPFAWSYKEYVWVTGLGGSVWRDKLEREAPDTDAADVKEVTALYTTPPELAELQADIARLTAENERLRQLPTRNALIKERDKLKDEIERLKGGQGEPVMKLEAERLWEGDGEYSVSFVKSGWLDQCRKTGGTFFLYTSQPAPVSVGYKLVPLTPTAAMVEAGINTLCGDDEHQDYRDVYTAMIGAAP